MEAEEIAEASDWCLRRGYQSLWLPAFLGPRGGKSSGTAILVVRDHGLTVPLGKQRSLVAGKLTAGILEVQGARPIMLASIYLEVGCGLKEGNLKILATLAATAEDWGLPFWAAGDFNLGPARLLGSTFAARSQANVIAPSKATCISSTSQLPASPWPVFVNESISANSLV